LNRFPVVKQNGAAKRDSFGVIFLKKVNFFKTKACKRTDAAVLADR
jgi:hypothetical protein